MVEPAPAPQQKEKQLTPPFANYFAAQRVAWTPFSENRPSNNAEERGAARQKRLAV